MSTFKCKMCDAILNVSDGTGVYECEYCGTKQTVVIDSNDIAAMFGSDSHDERRNVHKENESVSVEPLLKRAFMFLEDGDWGQAKQYCEKALDKDPENGRAYLGKLMADLKVCHEAELAEIDVDYRHYNNFEKAIRFGDPQMVKKLNTYSVESAYKLAVRLMDKAVLANDYRQAADQFRSVAGYKDADELAGKCDWFAKEKAAEEKKQRQEEKNKQEKELKQNNYNFIISFYIFFQTFFTISISASINKPVEKTINRLFLAAAFTVLGVLICRYFYRKMNASKISFWGAVIFNNIMTSIAMFIGINEIYHYNFLKTGNLWIKTLVAMFVCSLISGFIGDRLGKRKAEKGSRK